MTKYLENFKNNDDIIREYNAPEDALKGAKIHLAWYGYGSYCGDSLVVFQQNGKLYEVNGSHCSCYGLEGQWNVEETSWEALGKRQIDSYCESGGEAQNILTNLVKKHSK